MNRRSLGREALCLAEMDIQEQIEWFGLLAEDEVPGTTAYTNLHKMKNTLKKLHAVYLAADEILTAMWDVQDVSVAEAKLQTAVAAVKEHK